MAGEGERCRGHARSGTSPAGGGAELLVNHISLLFVPAGVGLVAFFPRIRAEWAAILVSYIVGAFASLALCLNGVAPAVLAPIIMRPFTGA